MLNRQSPPAALPLPKLRPVKTSKTLPTMASNLQSHLPNNFRAYKTIFYYHKNLFSHNSSMRCLVLISFYKKDVLGVKPCTPGLGASPSQRAGRWRIECPRKS